MYCDMSHGGHTIHVTVHGVMYDDMSEYMAWYMTQTCPNNDTIWAHRKPEVTVRGEEVRVHGHVASSSTCPNRQPSERVHLAECPISVHSAPTWLTL